MKDIVIDNTKRCGKCKQYKEFFEFHKDKDNKIHGCASFCKPCTLIHRREKKVEYAETRKKYRSKPNNRFRENANQKARLEKNPSYTLLMSAKTRSIQKGWICDLELSDIIIPDLCPVLKVPLIKRTAYAPSIDRIDSTKGYVKGNITIVSKQANVMKNNATLEELRNFCNNAFEFYRSQWSK